MWESRKRVVLHQADEEGGCRDFFEVNNYEDAYAGLTTLARATTFSDNAVYANLGIQLGTQKIADAGAADGHPHARLAQPGDDRSAACGRA